MKPAPTYTWQLRQVMAAHGLWKTSDLGPLLAERGVVLSPAQIYRLAAQVPERLAAHARRPVRHLFLHARRAHRDGRGHAQAQGGAARGNGARSGHCGPPRRARVTPDAQ